MTQQQFDTIKGLIAILIDQAFDEGFLEGRSSNPSTIERARKRTRDARDDLIKVIHDLCNNEE